MSLYDDIDTDKASGASGWASGIKLMHNQLAFKKATITTPKRDQTRRVAGTKLPPVIDLKSRREEDENSQALIFQGQKQEFARTATGGSPYVGSSDPEWKFINEYDPIWPNDYEKVVKDMREKRDREEEETRLKEREERERKRRDKYHFGRCFRELSACVPAPKTWTHGMRLAASSHISCVETSHTRIGRHDTSSFPHTVKLLNFLSSLVFTSSYYPFTFKNWSYKHPRSSN